MSFAPPVRRGDFLFSSVLYADPGKDNRHARASVAELAALLRPEALHLYGNSSGPTVTAHAKDPPWHYYSAQLIHYGLPVTKDKNGAKVRLLNALNQFKLEVPAWILKLESELKKEWEKENNKLKKATKTPTTPKKVNERKTTPIQNNGVNVTVNLSFNNDLYNSGANSEPYGPSNPISAKRKRSAAPAISPTKSTKVKNDTTPRKKIKHESQPTTPRKRVKAEPTPALSRHAPYSSSIKTDPYANTASGQPGLLLSGLYQIDCLAANEKFGDHDLDLTVSRDPGRDLWWATFRWGAWDGIMQMNPGPSIEQPNCTFGWRLRDLQTGQLKFGRKCMGDISFSENGTLYGSLYDVPEWGTVQFNGTRMCGPSVEDDLQGEWDAFVDEAYRR